MATHLKEWAVTTPTGRKVHTKQYTASQIVEFTETVADSQTDFNISVAIDVTAVKSFYLVSDQDVTIESNDGSSPDDTLALKANVPYEWNTDSYDTFKFTVDVTSFKVTNASGETATVSLYALIDATP